MDPSKAQGKIREQMRREINARLDSERKWKFMSKPENNQFYCQSVLNAQIQEEFKEKYKNQPLSSPQDSSNKGESYFVSPVMFEAMNLCRCGRKKEGTHLIKCLQKCVIKYSDGQLSSGSTPTDEKLDIKPNIPNTSNDIYGYFQSKYKNLEKSTFYVTPKVHLKHKITDNIYDNIIIG